MSIRIPTANINSPISRNIVKQMASNGFLPVIALEAFVEGGRTYQAYKRGGFDEARERITEEFSGAVFWLGGVKGLNWLFEKMGQKMLGLPKTAVDIASDGVRKPLENFLEAERHANGAQILEKTMAKFKFAKVISSVILANAFIGFALPKINQAITRSYHKNKQPENIVNPISVNPRPTMDTFVQNNSNNNDKFDSSKIPFGINLLTIANKFENSRNYQLLSVDAGTASGRAYSARNNDERVEILFRDLSSIYFYMFNMANLNSWLNMAEHGSKTRLDPVSAEFATRYMENYIRANDFYNTKINAAKFAEEFLGTDKELPSTLKSKFSGEIITLENFKKELKTLVPNEQLRHFEEVAEKMSRLQPQIKGSSILTAGQARDVLNGGHINNPEFLMEFFKNRFGTRFMEKYQYVAQNDLDAIKKDLVNYVKSVVKAAEKTDTREVTLELLRKMSNKNLRVNALNWGAGFATSALFLSTLIPKMQYWITKRRTGSDNFPGTAQYREQEQKQAA